VRVFFKHKAAHIFSSAKLDAQEDCWLKFKYAFCNVTYFVIGGDMYYFHSHLLLKVHSMAILVDIRNLMWLYVYKKSVLSGFPLRK
jgi:hypothetical protein